MEKENGKVVAVCLRSDREFPKLPQATVNVGEHGLVGDAHAGELRRSYSNPDKKKPNDRAVSVCSEEVRRWLNVDFGFDIEPGDFNENILVEGLGDLGDLSEGDQLVFTKGDEETVKLQVSSQSYPCTRLEEHNGEGQNGERLTRLLTGRDDDGDVFNKRGVVATVLQTGELEPGQSIYINKQSSE